MRMSHVSQVLASAALFALVGAGFPQSALAGQLVSGVTAKVGGLKADVAAKVSVGGGGISADVDANLGTGTTAKASIGTVNGGVTAKADLARAIAARARVLGPKRLLKLCASVGAKGCDGKSRAEQIKLIDARLRLLSGKQLAGVCVAVGGSCGGGTSAAAPDPANGHAEAPRSTGKLSLASARGESDREMRLTCRSILRHPARYEVGLVKLCRQMIE